MRKFFFLLAFVAFAPVLMPIAGCHSSHIDVDVENRSGSPLRLLEVDYPSASFGADSLSSGAVMHYRIQIQGSGPLKVQYTAADGRQVQIDGPSFAERQEGSLKITLLPGGKADFRPVVTAVR